MKAIEEKLLTPVAEECDVLVVGGGFAGISSALSAAREGKSVILAERLFMLGGLATSGLIAIYLPLCDGYGRQVSFGIAEELLRLSIALHNDGKRGVRTWIDGVGERNEKTDRFMVNFNPQLFAIQAEQLLIENGVKILYGVSLTAATAEDGKITSAIMEGKSGRYAIRAGSYVDCSGDCDLARHAGAPTATFAQGNILAAWYYSFGQDGFNLHQLGVSDTPDEEKRAGAAGAEMLINRRFAGLEDAEISDFVVSSHSQVLNDFKKRKATDGSYEPTTIATMPQLRMTRRIDGEYTLTTSEMHKRFEDSVGLVSDWKKRGPVYEVPFRTLYSSKVKNLICAGRVTSVDDAMWDIMRVIPCCAVTGEAAGLAAAMTDDFSTLDVSLLQKKLAERGIPLHE